MNDKISITFDDENRIRVLEPEKFKDTETMRNESMEFIKSNFIRFHHQIRNYFLRRNYLRPRRGHGESSQKGRARKTQSNSKRPTNRQAVGERNKVEGEQEARKKKMIELNNIINEKRSELERQEFESLLSFLQIYN